MFFIIFLFNYIILLLNDKRLHFTFIIFNIIFFIYFFERLVIDNMNENTLDKNYSIQSVHRAIKVLRAFSFDNPRLTLMDLNRITGLSKSNLQRILYTLTSEGLLEKDDTDRTYQLGLEFLYFAELVDRNSALLSAAKSVVQKIHDRIKENISISIIEHNMRKCIYNVESEFELKTSIFVGQTSPLFAGASAKILLAYQSDEFIENYLNEIDFEQISENTITNKEDLLEEINKIREQGYAISNSERVKGTFSISTPIFNPFSKLIASLAISIPTARIDDYQTDEIVELMINGAKEITEKLSRK